MTKLELLSLKRAHDLLNDDEINLYCLVQLKIGEILKKNFPEMDLRATGVLLEAIYKEFSKLQYHIGESERILSAIIEDRGENDNK